MTNAQFIVFEGCEGSGKSTQLHLLNNYLKSKGINTWITKEPGGCNGAFSQLRDIILNPDVNPVTELFLMLADRSHHTNQIMQALNDDIWVLCDRFSWSTFAYQGYGHGFDLDFLKNLNDLATSGLKPDITFLLDIDPDLGIQRKRLQLQSNRIDHLDLDFHRRVREGYLKLFESILLSQDTVARLLYFKNKHTGTQYSIAEIFNHIVETLPL